MGIACDVTSFCFWACKRPWYFVFPLCQRKLSEHAGAVHQLLCVTVDSMSGLATAAAAAVTSHGCRLPPVSFSEFPGDCSLRLLTISVLESVLAFETLLRHPETASGAFWSMLDKAVAVLCHTLQADHRPRAASTDTETSAASALLQSTTLSADLVKPGHHGSRDACVRAVKTQPPPWLTPGVSMGVTALWLLLGFSTHSPLQFRGVLNRFPTLLATCLAIVKSASCADCFQATRGSGMHSPAWRLLQRVVECDNSFSRLDTRLVAAAVLTSPLCVPTEEVAVLVARVACALAEFRIQAVLDGVQYRALSALLASLLVLHGHGHDSAPVRRQTLAGIRLMLHPTPEAFRTPEVVQALIAVVCTAFQDSDAFTYAEQAAEVFDAVVLVPSAVRAGTTPVPDGIAAAALSVSNQVLVAMEACLGVVAAGIGAIGVCRHVIPFFSRVLDKWAPLASSGAGVVMPVTLPGRVAAILSSSSVWQQRYNAVYVVRLLGSRAPMRGLQAVLPELLRACEATDVLPHDLQELALSAVAGLLCNRAWLQSTSALIPSIFDLSVSAFLSFDHVARAAALLQGLPAPSCHGNDNRCASAVVCITEVLSRTDVLVHAALTSVGSAALRAQLLGNARFMQALHLMAHPAYGCVPARYSEFFPDLLHRLVLAHDDVETHRRLAVTAYLQAATEAAAPNIKTDVTSDCCCICLGALSVDGSPATCYEHRGCHQKYHAHCLGQWLSAKDSCPSCRGQVLCIA